MIRRRSLLAATLAAAGATGFGYGGWWAWDEACWMGLGANCQSDNLSVVAKHLREYAEGHEGRLPPAADLLAVAHGEHEGYLWCNKAGLPYQWDLRLAGSRLGGPLRRAVAWCPPGGHGRYVGVIVDDDGGLRVEGMTIGRLRRLVRGSEGAPNLALQRTHPAASRSGILEGHSGGVVR